MNFLLVALLSTNLGEARKSFLVKKQHPAVYAPRVQNYDTSIKIFDIINGKERYRMALDNQI